MVIFNSELYDLTQNTQGNLWGAALRAREVVPPPLSPVLQIRAGYAESPGWLMVQAREFDPEPLSVDILRRRAIWSAPGIIYAMLEILAGEKWLTRTGDHYHLTEAGRDILCQMQERRQNAMRLITPLPLEELQTLDRLLRRILSESLKSADTWCLRYSQRRAPAPDAPLVDQMIHHFSDFNAFRDDCHMAAFKPCDVEAYHWEALSLIWQDKAKTAQEVFDQLVQRGYSLEEFDAALAALVQRGWLTGDGVYTVTEEGCRMRETVEQQTDMRFFAPWQTALNPAELEQVVALMQKLHDATG